MEQRLSSQQLIEYTNDDNSATVINYTRLHAVCDDVLGEFRIKAKTEPDLNNPLHIAKLSSGVLYYLMFYRGRDAALLKNFEKKFYAGMGDIANMHYPLARSNSKLKQSKEKVGTLPDMDRSLTVFRNGRTTGSYPRETIGDS